MGLPQGEPFYFGRRNQLINYLMSLHILQMLKSKNLINEEEFTAIDNKNKRSFLT
ncbi:SHOCT domain-containing protein [Desulfosporosinus lacus]|uniref:SHOCT domain-containing protein n=1 Tax=Desulfosporosinus lacus TaxID=329936 RepID=UPI0031F33B7B